MKPLTRNDIHDLLAYVHTKACKGAKDTGKMAATKACAAHKAKIIQALFDPFKDLRRQYLKKLLYINNNTEALAWTEAIALLDKVIEAKE